MKLHHFCRASDLDSIAEKGLYPHVAHESTMSLGREVVWLTTQETTATTDEDVEHYRRASQRWFQAQRVMRTSQLSIGSQERFCWPEPSPSPWTAAASSCCRMNAREAIAISFRSN
jgi:hypothetical protein